MMLAAPLFAAARLTDVGLSILLASILFGRVAERISHHKNPCPSNEGGLINVDAVMLASACFVASALVVLPLPLSHYLFQWPPASRAPEPVIYLTLLLRSAVFAAMIYALAHNPKRQVFCCIGWALAVHTFILGPVAWALIH